MPQTILGLLEKNGPTGVATSLKADAGSKLEAAIIASPSTPGATESGTTVTITYTGTPNTFKNGDSVQIAGIVDSGGGAITGYYGTYTVSNCTANSFQYTALVSGLANGGNGVASAAYQYEVTAVNKATGTQGGETIPSALANAPGFGPGNDVVVSFSPYVNSLTTDYNLYRRIGTTAPFQLIASGTAASVTTTVTIGANAATESGTLVTITAPNTFLPGETVEISGVGVAGYNGTFTISSPTATSFQYTALTSGLAASGGGTATVLAFTDNGSATPGATAPTNSYGFDPLSTIFTQDIQNFFTHYTTANSFVLNQNPQSGTLVGITAATESGNTVTITATNQFRAGQGVQISGVGVAGYNGAFIITQANSTSFQYTNSITGLAPSSGGNASFTGTTWTGNTTTYQVGGTGPAYTVLRLKGSGGEFDGQFVNVYDPIFSNNTKGLGATVAMPAWLSAAVGLASPSQMIFACDGVFASDHIDPDMIAGGVDFQKAVGNIENDISTAFNRGIATGFNFAVGPNQWVAGSEYQYFSFSNDPQGTTGGTLTPGTTYYYVVTTSATAAVSGQVPPSETVPSRLVTVTLQPGQNAVQLSWVRSAIRTLLTTTSTEAPRRPTCSWWPRSRIARKAVIWTWGGKHWAPRRATPSTLLRIPRATCTPRSCTRTSRPTRSPVSASTASPMASRSTTTVISPRTSIMVATAWSPKRSRSTSAFST